MEDFAGLERDDEPSAEELIMRYLGGDVKVDGPPLMRRFLGRVGLDDKSQEPLVRRDGTPLTDEGGNPVLAQDYLRVASNHPGAVEMIIGFTQMSDQDPDFPAVKDMMTTQIEQFLASDADASQIPNG